jgi:signal transduction histidine kinase
MHARRLHLPLAARLHVPWRTVRARLTAVYGGLFLVLGAVALVITGVLWERATRSPFAGFHLTVSRVAGRITQFSSAPAPRKRGVVVLAQKVGAQLRIIASSQHDSDLHQLLLYSGIALAIMAIVAVVLGWLMAGRVLRPLRTITSAARNISATNLHERLAVAGPDDELKRLGDTFDELLERLDRSFQSQRQFVANASHELRTPLATMRASLDVALAKPEPAPPQMAALADRLHGELDHIDQLLESFLALARAQRGLAGDEVTVSLDLLGASALDERAAAIAEMALEVREEDCPEAIVTGSEILLSRMVGNVIDNAVRHNERGGWIRVRTSTGDDTANLIVENGGPAITKDAARELAQPFRRLGDERTGSDSGTGLGLSIVAAIAESHGGGLQLQPLDGGGLRVIVSLPLARHVGTGSPS